MMSFFGSSAYFCNSWFSSLYLDYASNSTTALTSLSVILILSHLQDNKSSISICPKRAQDAMAWWLLRRITFTEAGSRCCQTLVYVNFLSSCKSWRYHAGHACNMFQYQESSFWIWNAVQGTYLPAKTGLELADMQHLGKLPNLGKKLKSLYERLHQHHDTLRSRHPEIVNKSITKSPTYDSKMSERMESLSNWKYAAAPMKAVKDKLPSGVKHFPWLCFLFLIDLYSLSKLNLAFFCVWNCVWKCGNWVNWNSKYLSMPT